MTTNGVYGFSMWSRGIDFTCKCKICKRYKFDPWAGKMPWSWKRQPTPVFLPGESHGQRSLVGYSPWDHRELDQSQQQQLKWCLIAFFVQFNVANSLMRRKVSWCLESSGRLAFTHIVGTLLKDPNELLTLQVSVFRCRRQLRWSINITVRLWD